jgi:hypothetical protein
MDPDILCKSASRQLRQPLDAGELQPPAGVYEFLSAQVDEQIKLLRELSETAQYRERVEVLQSIVGV